MQREVIKAGGLALEYYKPSQIKDSTPILFCHGTGSGSWIWSNFCEYFSGKGWNTFAINYRGHYLSDPLPNLSECRFMDYVDDVESAVKSLGIQPYLFGHSLGGIVVQKYSERQNPAKLILTDSGTCKALTDKFDKEIVIKGMKDIGVFVEKDGLVTMTQDADKIKHFSFEPSLVEDTALQEYMEKQGWESRQAAMESAQIPVDPKKIKCPVYVIGKRNGFSTGLPTNQWLSEYYNAKDTQVFEPMGHCFMKEKNWKTYAEIIEKWLIG